MPDFDRAMRVLNLRVGFNKSRLHSSLTLIEAYYWHEKNNFAGKQYKF